MGLFNKIKTQANSIGSNISDSTSKLSGDILSSHKDNAKISAIKSNIASIDGQLEIGYLDIGKKYVDNLVHNNGENVELVLEETLSRIEPLLEKRAELEEESIKIEKGLKDQIVLQEKAAFQKEFDEEKEKLEKALKMDVITSDELNTRLAKAKLKLDNFDAIRKVKKQKEMGLISKEECKAQLESLGG